MSYEDDIMQQQSKPFISLQGLNFLISFWHFKRLILRSQTENTDVGPMIGL